MADAAAAAAGAEANADVAARKRPSKPHKVRVAASVRKVPADYVVPTISWKKDEGLGLWIEQKCGPEQEAKAWRDQEQMINGTGKLTDAELVAKQRKNGGRRTCFLLWADYVCAAYPLPEACRNPDLWMDETIQRITDNAPVVMDS